ncbi:MAG: DnaA N-terminal domain-containing protein [Sporolactobacillus sp.]
MNVITLCGSTKFKKQFEQVDAFLTLQGNIVISLPFFEQSDGFEMTREQAELLHDLHFRRIDISDQIVVIDVGGYIGNSTRKEIEYAEKNEKVIRYYSSFGEIPYRHQRMKLWEQALERIAGTIQPVQYKTWFDETTATYDGDTLIINCPNDFAKDWLYSEYSSVILKAVEQVTVNDEVKIGFRSPKQTVETFDKSRVMLIDD